LSRLQVLQPLRFFLTHRALLWKAVGVLRSGAQGKGVVNGSLTDKLATTQRGQPQHMVSATHANWPSISPLALETKKALSSSVLF